MHVCGLSRFRHAQLCATPWTVAYRGSSVHGIFWAKVLESAKKILGYLASHMVEGNGNPLQYSCLENPMDGGAWQAAVHGATKSQTRLSDFTFMHWRRKWQPTPVFLPGESQGWRSPVGCCLWGRTESDTTEATQQQQQQQQYTILDDFS